jgi:HlyD family secretion protein
MKQIIVFLLVSMGIFFSCGSEQIPPGFTNDTSRPATNFIHTAQVETRQIPQTHEAVGTIRPLTESVIESRVSAQVRDVSAAPGDRVLKDQTLVTLDDRQINSRLSQAMEGKTLADNGLGQALKAVDEARAGLEQARSAYERSQTLFEKHIVPSQKLEIDKAAYLTAKARLEKSQEAVTAARTNIRQAEQVVEEARILLAYTKITAPEDGVVVQRLVDPGDQAIPGRPLLNIQTSGFLRLEAHVREGLIRYIAMDQKYDVIIHTAEKTVPAVIREITPYADPETRTFLVKATLPEDPGVFPGMFGRLVIPVKQKTILVIPGQAVTRVGQLEMVHVKTKDNRFRSVYIKTGKELGPDITVLSGLTGNETLGW